MLTPFYSNQPITVRQQAAAADTLQANDNGNVVNYTSAAAVTITLPDQETLAGLAPGYNTNCGAQGAGLLTFQTQGEDLVFGYGAAGYFDASPHAAAGQGVMITVLLVSIDDAGNRTWQLIGALA